MLTLTTTYPNGICIFTGFNDGDSKKTVAYSENQYDLMPLLDKFENGTIEWCTLMGLRLAIDSRHAKQV